MLRKGLTTLTAALLGAATLCASAAAHGVSATELGGGGPDGVPAKVERLLGGEVTALANGLYRVHSGEGFSYTTHGPDFGPDVQRPFGAMEEAVAVADERAPACATDYYQEVLYGYPSTGTNQLATKKASIQAQIRTNNAILNAESLASGGPQADYKVRCDGDGSIRVTAFPVTPDLAGTSASFNQIVADAKLAGFGDGTTDTNVDYTIFYDGSGDAGACGIGYLYFNESKSANNPNNNPAGLEAGYAATFSGCWFGRTSMHENGHNQGAVQQGAPNSTGTGGHCNEADDVMCYRDGGSLNQNYPQTCPVNPGTLHFDCAYNTYFDSAPEAGEWLETHWNLGWSGNRFIQFGGPDVTPPDTSVTGGPTGTTADSTPTFSFSSSELNSTFQCRFDSQAFAPCSGPAAAHTPSSPLSDGPHTFEVFATDPAANADGSPASRAFSVDTQAAETQIDSAPAGTITASEASFSFSSPEAGTSFQCRLDAAAWSACASPHQQTGLSEGGHAFYVRALDPAGNPDPSPASASFQVDLPDPAPVAADSTPPQTTIGSGPARLKKGRNATFGFSSSESGSSFECRLDGGSWLPCASPQTLIRPKRGTHVFEVRATDTSGNVDPTPARHTFKVKKRR